MDMGIQRVVAAGIGMAAAALLVVGCSDSKPSEPTPSTAAGTQASSGGDTVVKVEGQDLAGVDLDTVTCVKQAGKINIGSASTTGGAQGLGVLLADSDPPKVESVALVVDGNALGVSNLGGVSTGSAEVAVDGSTYTITGEAVGADINNPLAGQVTKKFEIKVNCS